MVGWSSWVVWCAHQHLWPNQLGIWPSATWWCHPGTAARWCQSSPNKIEVKWVHDCCGELQTETIYLLMILHCPLRCRSSSNFSTTGSLVASAQPRPRQLNQGSLSSSCTVCSVWLWSLPPMGKPQPGHLATSCGWLPGRAAVDGLCTKLVGGFNHRLMGRTVPHVAKIEAYLKLPNIQSKPQKGDTVAKFTTIDIHTEINQRPKYDQKSFFIAKACWIWDDFGRNKNPYSVNRSFGGFHADFCSQHGSKPKPQRIGEHLGCIPPSWSRWGSPSGHQICCLCIFGSIKMPHLWHEDQSDCTFGSRKTHHQHNHGIGSKTIMTTCVPLRYIVPCWQIDIHPLESNNL